jgi:hypothetical protein
MEVPQMMLACVVCRYAVDAFDGSCLPAGWITVSNAVLPNSGTSVTDFLVSRNVVDAATLAAASVTASVATSTANGGSTTQTTTLLCGACASVVGACDYAYARYVEQLNQLKRRVGYYVKADDPQPQQQHQQQQQSTTYYYGYAPAGASSGSSGSSISASCMKVTLECAVALLCSFFFFSSFPLFISFSVAVGPVDHRREWGGPLEVERWRSANGEQGALESVRDIARLNHAATMSRRTQNLETQILAATASWRHKILRPKIAHGENRAATESRNTRNLAGQKLRDG